MRSLKGYNLYYVSMANTAVIFKYLGNNRYCPYYNIDKKRYESDPFIREMNYSVERIYFGKVLLGNIIKYHRDKEKIDYGYIRGII